jgi:hypothetical protein
MTDDAVISPAGITVTHKMASANDSVNSLVSNAAISISAGSLSIAMPSTINNTLNITGGTLAGAGSLAVAGLFTWIQGGTLADNLTANGGMAFLGIGGVSPTLTGTLNIPNGATANFNAPLIGTHSVLELDNGTINNQGTTLLFGSQILQHTNGTGQFNNYGSLIASSNSASQIAVPTTNFGTMAVADNGNLIVTLAGTSTGSFVGDPGSSLRFDTSGDAVVGPSSSITGDYVDFGPGSLTIDCNYDARSITTFLGGTTFTFFNGTVTSLGNSIDDRFGTADFTHVANPSTFTLDSLTLAGGAILGPENFDVQTLDWADASGALRGTGTVNVLGTMTAQLGLTLSGYTIDNFGTATWQGFQGQAGQALWMQNGAVFNNFGTVTASASFGTEGGVFNNVGTFTLTGSGSIFTFDSIVNNNGMMHALAGTSLTVGSGGVSGGSFVGDNGSMLTVAEYGSHDGNFTLLPSSSLIGDTITFNATYGAIYIEGIYQANQTILNNFAGGEFFNGPLTATSMGTSMTFEGHETTAVFSAVPNPPTLVLDTFSIFTSSNAGFIRLGSLSIRTTTFTWDNEASDLAVCSLEGSGTITATGQAAITGAAPHALDGCTLVTNNASLTGGGSISLYNGAVWNNSGGALTNTGVISGDGTLGLNLTNDGTIKPGHSPGRIKSVGTFDQGTTGTVKVEIGGMMPATQYDQLEVKGAISLAGNLQVGQLYNFFPAPGDSFTVLQNDTTTPITGTFSGLPEGSTLTTQWQDGSGNMHSVNFTISYKGGAGGDSVVLTDQSTTPTNVAAVNPAVQVMEGQTAKNSGTWLDTTSGATVTITASVGTIVQTGTTGSGTWSWSYDTKGVPAEGVPVTITQNDGTTSIITTFTLAIQDTTTTTVTASPSPAAFGQLVTLSATVAPIHSGATVLPTGSVTFLDGTTVLAANVGLDSSGHAVFETSELAGGNHTITASYSGDLLYMGSTGDDSASPLMVTKGDTDAIEGYTPPSTYGQAVTFTAAADPAALGAALPSGNIKFLEGTRVLGTGTLSSAVLATFSTSSLSAGSHTITASYAGDGSYHGSMTSFVQSVSQDASRAAVKASVNPSVFGQPVTFTATVRATLPGSGIPTGSVTFKDGTSTLGTGTLNSAGQATYSTAMLSRSSHGITVVYGGDSNFTPSTSGPYGQTVNKAMSATSLGASTGAPVYGQSVTFTASVTAVLTGVGIQTGTVTFKDGTAVLASGVTLNSSGRATFSTVFLALGSHMLSASYGGDGNFLASNGNLTLVVGKAATTTSKPALAPASVVFGQADTFTVMVTAVAPEAGTPSGTVTFKDASTVLGTGTLDASGHATFSTASLAVGSHAINATYSGDSNFKASPQSLAAGLTVAKANSTTGMASPVNPGTAGQPVTFTATVRAIPPGAGQPSGTVFFRDTFTSGGVTKTVTLGSSRLTLSGNFMRATFSTASLTAGNHTITGIYTGDIHFGGSTRVYGETVNPASSLAGATFVTDPLPRTFPIQASYAINSGAASFTSSSPPALNGAVGRLLFEENADHSVLGAANVDSVFSTVATKKTRAHQFADAVQEVTDDWTVPRDQLARVSFRRV